MKYFIMTDRSDTKSVWAQRPDGLERCIYDAGPYKDYSHPVAMWSKWVDPHEHEEKPIHECNVVEVSEEEALIECI